MWDGRGQKPTTFAIAENQLNINVNHAINISISGRFYDVLPNRIF
jgi:hypothetical protein